MQKFIDNFYNNVRCDKYKRKNSITGLNHHCQMDPTSQGWSNHSNRILKGISIQHAIHLWTVRFQVILNQSQGQNQQFRCHLSLRIRRVPRVRSVPHAMREHGHTKDHPTEFFDRYYQQPDKKHPQTKVSKIGTKVMELHSLLIHAPKNIPALNLIIHQPINQPPLSSL